MQYLEEVPAKAYLEALARQVEIMLPVLNNHHNAVFDLPDLVIKYTLDLGARDSRNKYDRFSCMLYVDKTDRHGFVHTSSTFVFLPNLTLFELRYEAAKILVSLYIEFKKVFDNHLRQDSLIRQLIRDAFGGN